MFYPAEDYHQDYYKKNPAHYNRYFEGSGRAAFVKSEGGFKMKEKLTEMQYLCNTTKWNRATISR